MLRDTETANTPLLAALTGTLRRCTSLVWLATPHSARLALHPASTTKTEHQLFPHPLVCMLKFAFLLQFSHKSGTAAPGAWQSAGSRYEFRADGTYKSGYVDANNSMAIGACGRWQLDGHLIALHPDGDSFWIIPSALSDLGSW